MKLRLGRRIKKAQCKICIGPERGVILYLFTKHSLAAQQSSDSEQERRVASDLQTGLFGFGYTTSLLRGMGLRGTGLAPCRAWGLSQFLVVLQSQQPCLTLFDSFSGLLPIKIAIVSFASWSAKQSPCVPEVAPICQLSNGSPQMSHSNGSG